MPIDFILDTSSSNTIAYAFTTGFNNRPINSNLLIDFLTPYISSNVINNVLSSYISSNVLNNRLTPYDTIALRNTTLTSYLLSSTATSTYATIANLNLKENILSFNSPLTRNTNTIGIDLSAYSTTGNMNTAISTALNSYTNTTSLNNYTSNYISSNIINNLLSPYDTVNSRISAITTALNSYTNTTSLNNYTSNYISSNIINNILIPYISSNVLQNSLTEIYDKYSLQENQYPPQAYNTSTEETTTTLLNKTVNVETITLSSASYGNGDYIVYSSSTYSTGSKKYLFNYITVENPTSLYPSWGLNNYTAGIYNKDNFIKSDYLGDWVILKLPSPIILTKFQIVVRPSFSLRAPGLWRCYGSMDGITFNEIVEGHNDITRLTTAAYPGNAYIKILNTTFNTPYLYIGFTFNAMAGSDNILNFGELRIYGRGFLTPSEKYISSNIFYSNLNLSYNYINNYSSNFINSNVINNILLPYSSYTYLNNYSSNFISSNLITNILLPYDTIALRNNALLPYSSYTYLNNYSSNFISSNLITNILLPYDTIALRNTTLTSYTTTSALTTLLSAKEASLTFSAPLTRSVNTISLDLSSYDTIVLRNSALASYLPLTGGTITGNLIINATNPAFYFGGGSGAAVGQASSAGAFSTGANIGDAIIRSQAGKWLILQSGSGGPAITVNDVNSVTVHNTLSAGVLMQGSTSINTLISNAVSSYLPLIGGALTGNLTNTNNISVGTTNISSKLTVNNIVVDRNIYDHSLSPMTITHQTAVSSTILNDPQPILNLCRQGTSGQSYGTKATISLCRYENNSINSRTRMDISLANGAYDNNNIMTMLSSGNVGIRTTNPLGPLHINEATGTAAGANSGSIIIDHDNTNGVSSIIFRSKVNRGSDFAYIQYNDNLGGVGESAKLIIGTQNDADDDIILMPSGKVGIGTALPQSLLDVSGLISCSTINASGGYSYFNGLRINGTDGNTIWQPTGILGISANTGYTIPFAIGNGNVITTITDTGMTFKDYSYIQYANALYFKNTTANKTITMSAGNLNVPENINVAGYINLTSAVSSYLTFADKWKIGIATALGVANSLVFNHIDTGINSYWFFSGTQASTASEISDERVKKQIEPISDGLNKLMKLKPKEYYLCDDKDYNKKFGIIAQDVEIDFPELIYTDTEYIANIYSYATYDNFIITFDKDITDLITLDDELKIILDNNDKNNLEIVIDDTPYNNRYKRRFCKVVEIIDNYSIKIDIELQETNIFVFGKKETNFKKLDYQSLYCLNIAATQELLLMVQELRSRIETLENR